MAHNAIAEMFPFLPWGQNVSHGGGGGVNTTLPPGASFSWNDPNVSVAPGFTSVSDQRAAAGLPDLTDPNAGTKPGERPILDDPYRRAEDYGSGLIGEREEDKVTALERAIETLMGLDRTIRTEFNQRREDVSGALPLDPFSDELRQRRIDASNDMIRREIADLSGRQSQNLSNRGFGGSGVSAGAFANLQGLGVETRVTNTTQIFDEQRKFNARQNAIRESMLNQILGGKTDLLSRLGTLTAGLQTEAFEDPSDQIANFNQFFTAMMGGRQAEEMIELAKQQGRELDPTLANLISGVLGPAALAAGLPGAAAMSGSIDLFDAWSRGSNAPWWQG